MAIHILIDGYNLIRNYPPLTRVEYRDFTKGREALLQWLARYRQTTPNPITVVFDGQKGSGLAEERDVYKGIKILYSHAGQTADEGIKRLAAREGGKFLVVTSDLELSTYCRSYQTGSIRSEEFAHKVEEKILKRDKGVIEEEEPEILPKKKKGTAFRISKKAKREKKFWEHL